MWHMVVFTINFASSVVADYHDDDDDDDHDEDANQDTVSKVPS